MSEGAGPAIIRDRRPAVARAARRGARVARRYLLCVPLPLLPLGWPASGPVPAPAPSPRVPLPLPESPVLPVPVLPAPVVPVPVPLSAFAPVEPVSPIDPEAPLPLLFFAPLRLELLVLPVRALRFCLLLSFSFPLVAWSELLVEAEPLMPALEPLVPVLPEAVEPPREVSVLPVPVLPDALEPLLPVLPEALEPLLPVLPDALESLPGDGEPDMPVPPALVPAPLPLMPVSALLPVLSDVLPLAPVPVLPAVEEPEVPPVLPALDEPEVPPMEPLALLSVEVEPVALLPCFDGSLLVSLVLALSREPEVSLVPDADVPALPLLPVLPLLVAPLWASAGSAKDRSAASIPVLFIIDPLFGLSPGPAGWISGALL